MFLLFVTCWKLGFSPKSISEKTGFGIDFVRNIYDGHTWKYITKSKNFSKVILYNKFFNISEIRQMESLFLNGYSVKEVINKMNWEYNELIRGRVRQFKKQCERYWNAKNN